MFGDARRNKVAEVGFVQKFIGRLWFEVLRFILIDGLVCRVGFIFLEMFSQQNCSPKCLDLPRRHRRQKTRRDIDDDWCIIFSEIERIKQDRERQTRHRRHQIEK